MIIIFIFVIITLIIVLRVAQPADRAYLFKVVSLAWLLLPPLLYFTNEAIPFAGGGDDEVYFNLAATPMTSLRDFFDINQFNQVAEQPGYPSILAILTNISSHDLFILKMFNFFIFILIVITWYLIGTFLEKQNFGRYIVIAILMLMPLWYYFYFLLKDILITLFESLFLLGLVSSRRHKGMNPWMLMAASTIAVLPFRTPTALINAAVLVFATMLKNFASGQNRGGAYHSSLPPCFASCSWLLQETLKYFKNLAS